MIWTVVFCFKLSRGILFVLWDFRNKKLGQKMRPNPKEGVFKGVLQVITPEDVPFYIKNATAETPVPDFRSCFIY